MCTALTILTLSFWFVLEAGLVIEEAYQLYLTELDVPSDFRISMVVSWFPREEILRKSPRVVATGGLFLAVDRGGGTRWSSSCWARRSPLLLSSPLAFFIFLFKYWD